MPAAAFADALACLLAMMVASEMDWIRPPPNVGVGMRAIRLWVALAVAKSGWVRVQPVASERPAMVNRSCTPPSLTKRASRTGPLELMNGWPSRNGNDRSFGLQVAPGAQFFCPTVACGLVEGLVPPTSGWAWQPEHWSRLNRGPSPEPVPGIVPETESISLNLFSPSVKNACCAVVRTGIIPPAPGGLPRTSGAL